MFLGTLIDIISGLSTCVVLNITIYTLVLYSTYIYLLTITTKHIYGLSSSVLILSNNYIIQSLVFGIE